MRATFVLVSAILGLLSSAALAAPRPAAQSDWDITLGAGAGLSPTFAGSDRYRVRPLPLVAITWRDTISVGEGGLSAYWHHGRFRIGGGLTFDGGREDHNTGGIFDSGDDRLMGLGKINASLGLRAFASYKLGPANFDVSATKFTGGQNHGVLVNFGLGAPLPLGRRLVLIPHLRATWANGNYTQTYFGVTPVQAAASMFPQFNAGAGLKDVRGGANLIWRFNRHWFIGMDASAGRLLGDAAKSPISFSDTDVTVFATIGYHFGR